MLTDSEQTQLSQFIKSVLKEKACRRLSEGRPLPKHRGWIADFSCGSRLQVIKRYIVGFVGVATMGWNVYDEPVLTRSTTRYQVHGEKEVLADIFLQHAVEGSLAMSAWYSAAQSFSREFGDLLWSASSK